MVAPEAPLWTPSPARAAATALARFAAAVGVEGYEALHAWSVADPAGFWRRAWAATGLVGDPGDVALEEPGAMPDARFFPEGRLSIVENLLGRRGPGPALVFRGEDGTRRELSWDDLARLTGELAAALTAAGVGPGDRVAAWLPNVPEAVAVMLAATAVGAVFSSTSPDFGVDGVVDRFGQIGPVVLVAADGYHYGGRWFDCRERLAAVLERLPTVRACVVLGDAGPLAGTARVLTWDAFLAPHRGAALTVERRPFDHPWYVLYSSGTTGPPKCIVHRTGGVLLKHLVEHQLHCDVRPGDRVLYFTTTGWMMWNWLVSALASGATVVLYDGSPFHPGPEALFDLVDAEGLTFLGVSAKFLDSVKKTGWRPAATHSLASLRTIASTGSPLAPETFAFVYDAVRADVHLASISGGTDLCGCFVAGDPTGPVWAGEIQRPALGMATEVWDERGRPVVGERGELVCTRPFPSMPLGFWADPDGERYRRAYYAQFPGVWSHGDFATRTTHGGFVIHGRSDTTLNPGGVRIGTAEIYRQVEQIPAVLESLVFGQELGGDTRIVLLVRLAPGHALTPELEDEIRRRIRTGCTPRHVPAVIAPVDDLPRTRSGKLAELAVTDAVNGRPVRNTEALANPESLAAIAARPELRAPQG